MERVICVVIGYLFGLFQTGYLVGKMKHIDIRKQGSGNAGSTNALRVMGVKAGLLTLFGDCVKCVLAVLVCRAIFMGNHADELSLLTLYAGFGATLGHNFPFWLKFKGGKGIAVLAGVYLTTNLWMTLIGFLIFVAIVALTRYVSLASLTAALLFPIGVIFLGQMGKFNLSTPLLYEMYVVAFLIGGLAWWRHRANIVRLIHGEENKLGAKK